MTLRAAPAAVTDPSQVDVVEASVAMRAGQLSSVELTRSYLRRIELVDDRPSLEGDPGSINAFVRMDAESALEAAAAADRRRVADTAGAPRQPLDS
jgi:Asp-tRNA(Asn)/Glu-tRNA(Gln) amidotransferase A subunit family amidase